MFTAGWGEQDGWNVDYRTVAYDSTTGSELWTARYDSGGIDEVYDIAVSLDGKRVFLTGRCCGLPGGGNWRYGTVAYDAITGTHLWTSLYDGEAGLMDWPLSVEVAPDGERVYVTGVSARDATTIAYDAATGTELWRSAYAGPEAGVDQGFEVKVAPDGKRVYVSGGSWGGDASNYDYLIVAYDAEEGEELWATRLGNGAGGSDVAQTLAVSPDGTRLVASGVARVAGTTTGGLFANNEFLTIGVDAATGDVDWQARYASAAGGLNGANDVVLSPDNRSAFVTGISTAEQALDTDVLTIAYDTQTGAERWVARLATPGHWSEGANQVGVTPDGSRVFASGWSLALQGNAVLRADTVTTAYNAVTGAQVWAARQNTSPAGIDTSYFGYLAVDPDGKHVYTAGASLVKAESPKFVTMAYPVKSLLESLS